MRPSSATAASRESGFNARLRQAREGTGLSQQQIADEIGVSRDIVSQWERGVSGVSWENLRQLAQALDCSEDWLRLGDQLDDFPARDRHDATVVGEFVADMNRELDRVRDQVVHDRASGTGGFLIATLVDLQRRVATIEAVLSDGQHAATGDELVDASRRVKAALAGGLDEQGGGSATQAEPGTRREADATSESA